MGFRTVQVDTMQALATFTAGATSTNDHPSGTAQTIEIWVRILAIGMTTTVTVFVDVSADGTNFTEIDVIPGITANGVYPITIDRRDKPLGVTARTRFTLDGTTPTADIEILMVRQER